MTYDDRLNSVCSMLDDQFFVGPFAKTLGRHEGKLIRAVEKAVLATVKEEVSNPIVGWKKNGNIDITLIDFGDMVLTVPLEKYLNETLASYEHGADGLRQEDFDLLNGLQETFTRLAKKIGRTVATAKTQPIIPDFD